MLESIMEKLPMILGIALCLSEALSFFPKIKANSIFQMISNGLKKAKDFLDKFLAKKKEEEKEEEKKDAE